MKRSIQILLLVMINLVWCKNISAQSTSSFKAANDFFLNMLYNPQFSIGDFLTIGLNSQKLYLKDLSAYLNNPKVQKKCAEQNINLITAYNKVSQAWAILKEVEDVNLTDYYAHYSKNNIMAIQRRISPETQHKLRIIPLKMDVAANVSTYPQRVLRPKSATITDGLNSYTSKSFDCPSMTVIDKGRIVTIIWGGDTMNLSRKSANDDTYTASTVILDKKVAITAYRSSKTRRIYLVTVVQKQGSETIRINFK